MCEQIEQVSDALAKVARVRKDDWTTPTAQTED
jgi:hypothetical protein